MGVMTNVSSMHGMSSNNGPEKTSGSHLDLQFSYRFAQAVTKGIIIWHPQTTYVVKGTGDLASLKTHVGSFGTIWDPLYNKLPFGNFVLVA